MGRSAKEFCRPPQIPDGGGKVDYGDDGEEPWLNQIVKAGAKFYMQKELADEFGEGIGSAIKESDSE